MLNMFKSKAGCVGIDFIISVEYCYNADNWSL